MSTNASDVDINRVTGIELGKRYRISLDDDGGITTLQYHFKPVSVANQLRASLTQADSGESVLDVEGSGGVSELFKGSRRQMTSSDHEFVLVRVGEVFKLRKIDHAVVNLRVQREEDETKTKLQSLEESKQLMESKKLPKFLQKQHPKKKSVETKNSTAPSTEVIQAPTTAPDGNTNSDVVPAPTTERTSTRDAPKEQRT
jgi:hypothetical protein